MQAPPGVAAAPAQPAQPALPGPQPSGVALASAVPAPVGALIAAFGDARNNVEVKGKFRVLLHPNNRAPRRTAEGVIMLVQVDDQHMIPVELRPVPGKSRFQDPQDLRNALVEAIDSMLVIGAAMAGPRLAVEALAAASVAAQQQQQPGGDPAAAAAATAAAAAAAAAAARSEQQLAQLQSQMAAAMASPPGSPPPVASPGKTTAQAATLAAARAAAQQAAAASARGVGGSPLRRGGPPTLVEQLETGARARLESSFLELMRTLATAAQPSRGGGGGGGRLVLPTIPFVPWQSATSPHGAAAHQNVVGDAGLSSPLSGSRQPMQRGGAVPIAVARVASQQSLFGGGWDYQHLQSWPVVMPGDDVSDFRLHIARILKRRAGL